MRLPQLLLDSPFFQFSKLAELERAVGDSIPTEEHEEVQRLVQLGLPPISSRFLLAAMLGISPGLVWSFESRTHRYYRTFFLPKGNSRRRIDAPRVGLKIIQKWLSVQLQRTYCHADHVYGFVPKRSHVQAAAKHCSARWVLSVDIQDFFQSTPQTVVARAFEEMGYRAESAQLLARLCCLRGMLAQGAPSSPIISNICFQPLDNQLAALAKHYQVRLTRYADDIVFSGTTAFPEALREDITILFNPGPWRLAAQKTYFSRLPNRLKVHGLLVHGERVRLTKGYRNKLRSFRHILTKGKVKDEDLAKIKGHLTYGAFIEQSGQH